MPNITSQKLALLSPVMSFLRKFEYIIHHTFVA